MDRSRISAGYLTAFACLHLPRYTQERSPIDPYRLSSTRRALSNPIREKYNINRSEFVTEAAICLRNLDVTRMQKAFTIFVR